MSGGAFVTIKVGRSGTAGDHARYITRERATEGKQERVWTHNVPEYADHPDHDEQGMTYKERAGDLREYARQLEEDELERPQRGSGQKRTHYRAIYSFDREVTDEKARAMVDQHLEENFPKARVIAAIHRDTDNAHVHAQIAARGTDDKKLHFNDHAHRRLDERWARIYGREYGREVEREHAAKKELWREWMREARQAKLKGREIPPRPKRVAHERNQVAEKRKMHAKQYGLNHADQTGIRDDQRRAANGERGATAREQHAGATTRSTDRELAGNHGPSGSVSQQTTGERDRQQPGRGSRADRAVSHRTPADDRVGPQPDAGAGQAGAAPANDAGQKRGDDAAVYEQHRRGEQSNAPAQSISDRVARPAENNPPEDRGRDVRGHDISGAFDRVLRLMETVTDKARDRGRDQVAGADRRDAGGANQRDRAGDREQALSEGTKRPDRGADHRRERTTEERRADADIAGGIITDAAKSIPRQAQEKIAEKIEAAIEKPPRDERLEAGRWRAQYLIEIAQISLQERATGKNAYTERQHLQGTMREMWEAEARHEKQYGGRPRPVLTKEERDYLVRHLSAMDGHAHGEIKKELGQAYIIGEARRGESLERQPERRQERDRDRDIGFSR